MRKSQGHVSATMSGIAPAGSRTTLAAAMVVCHGWTSPARCELFRRMALVSPFLSKRKRRAELMAA